jgi:pimeloyl-ACP methyl ester carboxylesterase
MRPATSKGEPARTDLQRTNEIWPDVGRHHDESNDRLGYLSRRHRHWLPAAWARPRSGHVARCHVYLPDRRGRGRSGPYRADHSIHDDVDDLAAILAETGANSVFGVSSAGIICLQAALTLPAIRKAAIYEPPLFADRSVPAAIVARFDQEMARGRVVAALIAGMKGSRLGPRIFNAVPGWVLEPLVRMAMAGEDRKPHGDYATMRTLASTLHYDFRLVADMSGPPMESFREIQADMLLLGGSKSPAYLKAALDALGTSVPNAKRVELAGLNHGASWNSDRGGRPGPLARELRRFLS